jgi:glycosyltransferase involved in cell wall biosynthesis
MEDLLLDHCERYAFEHADVQLAHGRDAFEYVRSVGWRVTDGARVVPRDGHVGAVYEQLAEERTDRPTAEQAAGSTAPLVTVAVTYYNLPEFLPETLAAVAAQTYPHLEVLVVDDGSTDPAARRVFEEQRRLYPRFRFLNQPNGGLSAARNRALAEAQGEYFLPVDADNVPRPGMVAAFVRGLLRNPELSALSCYFLAFAESADLATGRYAYAYRPTAGPHVMACFRNVYGDANAIFRTADLRAIGGYEPDRDSTCEDWEVFVILVHAGYQLDVVPEHLFYYRHRPGSLVKSTDPYLNRRRVLRHYFRRGELPLAERIGLWSLLGGVETMPPPAPPPPPRVPLRYVVADRVHAVIKRLPGLRFLLRRMLNALRAGSHAAGK